MKQQVLSVDLPRIDADTQSRLAINEDVVADYAEIIAQAGIDWPFPPLDVFHDGTDYFVADGFHRLLAALRAKRASVPCNVHKGTAIDAHIFGMTANDRHGLRMSREDKRACVEWLLDNGGKMTQAAIAEKAGVTTRTVQNVVADRKPSSIAGKTQPPKVETKLSSNTPISGGTKAKPPTSAPEPVPAKEPEPDLGKCPNCAGEKWTQDEFGMACAKCRHPWGEPAGDVDDDNIKTQRQKTIKTDEALMRAFDDLHCLCPKPLEHAEAIASCKILLRTAKGWK